jgi:hypothetical protein
LLNDLDRDGLRRVALEALLMADGPDRIDGEVDDDKVNVLPLGQD